MRDKLKKMDERATSGKMKVMWDKLSRIQDKHGHNESVKEVLHEALRWHVATCGGSSKTAPENETVKAKMEFILEEKNTHNDAMDLIAGIQSLATDLSRAPTFHRRFGGVLRSVCAEKASHPHNTSYDV